MRIIDHVICQLCHSSTGNPTWQVILVENTIVWLNMEKKEFVFLTLGVGF